MEQEVIVALGSNLSSQAGSPSDTLAAALRAMPLAGLRIRRVSRFFATPCFPQGAGPDYVNAGVVLSSEHNPRYTLLHLHAIEAQFSRERLARWGSRTLDLDLLAVGGEILPDRVTSDAWRNLPAETQSLRAPDELILPHPRMHERAFVLVPLNDIAPDWRHPILGQTVSEMTRALPPGAVEQVIAL